MPKKNINLSGLSEPYDLSQHPDLEVLYLTKTDFSLLEGFETVPKLRALLLVECGLKSVPDLSALQALSTLDLSLNYDLKDYDGLASLALESLTMKGCDLREIPSSVKGVTGLKRLILEDNFTLKAFDHLQGLALDELNLSRCRLSALPETLSEVPTLRVLEIGRNSNLESLAGIENSAVEKLGARTNSKLSDISALPEARGLVDVDLAMCVIAEIPENIANLTNLTRLDLSYNTEMKGLGHLARIPNLETLELNECGLKKLPPEFAEFRSLDHLSVHHNKIKNLDVVPASVTVSRKPQHSR